MIGRHLVVLRTVADDGTNVRVELEGFPGETWIPKSLLDAPRILVNGVWTREDEADAVWAPCKVCGSPRGHVAFGRRYDPHGVEEDEGQVMRFTSFAATVMVLGVERPVMFNEGTIAIGGITPDDVMKVVGLLGGAAEVPKAADRQLVLPLKTEVAVDGAAVAAAVKTPASAGAPAGEKAPEAPAARKARASKADAAPPPAQTPTPPTEPVVKTPGVSAAGAQAAVAQEAPARAPESWVEGDAKPVEEKPAETPAPAAEAGGEQAPDEEPPVADDDIPFGGEAPAGEPGAIPATLPENIVKAARMRDVLDYLIGLGVPETVAGLSAGCATIADRVPLVKRIENIPDRVERTLKVMGKA